MANSKQIRQLATSPTAYLKFLSTGRLPRGEVPSGPLVEFFKRVSPRDLSRVIGVTVDERLGYLGTRQFANGLQAQRWVHPSDEVFGSFPADSWRIKGPVGPLTILTLQECSSEFPEELVERYRNLTVGPY